jgi:hypothetical protein
VKKLQAVSRIRIGTQSVGHTVYIVARVYSYLLGLQEPKFVTGYSGTEIDLALLRGEVGARANIPDTVVQRSPHWIEKDLVDFHVVLEIHQGFRMHHPAFERQPALEKFAKTDKERQILEMFRAFRIIGSPFIISPGVPKQRVEVLKEVFRNIFKDPKFAKTFRKLTGADASPLTPEEQEKTIRNIPRDPEIIALFKKIASAGPLPSRCSRGRAGRDKSVTSRNKWNEAPRAYTRGIINCFGGIHRSNLSSFAHRVMEDQSNAFIPGPTRAVFYVSG